MGVFSDNKHEITCVYNSNNDTDRQVLGYLKAAEKQIHVIDISKETLTGTQWVELAERLNVSLKTLINEASVNGNINGFDDDACITILRETPNAVNGAIVFTKNKAMQIQKPASAQEFLANDSAAIPKPYNR